MESEQREKRLGVIGVNILPILLRNFLAIPFPHLFISLQRVNGGLIHINVGPTLELLGLSSLCTSCKMFCEKCRIQCYFRT